MFKCIFPPFSLLELQIPIVESYYRKLRKLNKFLEIMIEYLNDNNINTNLLNLVEVEDKRSVTTRAFFDDSINEFGIDSKIIFVATDNAADVKAAFNDQIYVWLGCSAHQLQLVLKHTIDDIKKDEDKYGDIIELINSVRSLVTFVNHSKKQNLFDTTLKQESNVRFDSLYLMLHSVQKNSDAISKIKDASVLSHLNEIDFDLLLKITSVPKLFYDRRIEISLFVK